MSRNRSIVIDEENADAICEALNWIEWYASELRRAGIPATAQIPQQIDSNLYENDGLTVQHVFDLADTADRIRAIVKPE